MQSQTDTVSFGTDGIRQTAGEWPLDAAGAQRIGMGLGSYLRTVSDSPRVLIGRDTRISGDFLLVSLCSGLLAYGIDVVDVGIITTAGVAYLAKKHQLDTAIIISASHNPWTENGLKLIGPDGLKLSDATEATIESMINANTFAPGGEAFGRIAHRLDWVEDYVQHLIEPFKGLAFDKLHVVLDCSNGAAAQIAPRCFELLGSHLTVLHNAPTGANINVESGSEVARASQGDLARTVLERSAHLGAAFDGDADRAIFVDEHGNLVDGDHILFMFGRHLDAAGDLPGKTVVTTEMANSGLDTALSHLGISVTRTKVGDKYVIRELLDKKQKLGGEQSGHIVILDEEHTTGDGIYTALYLAHILLQADSPSLHRLTQGLTKVPQVIASARVSSKPDLEQAEGFMDERERVLDSLGEGAIVNTRYSGTEPVLRVMIQGTPSHSLDHITRQAIRLCRALQKATGDANGQLEVKDCTTGASIDVSTFERL